MSPTRFLMRRAELLLALTGVGLLTGVACSSSDSGGGGGGATSTSTTSSTSTGSGGGQGGQGGSGGGLISVECRPACGAGQFCSSAGSCIDDGTCLKDADCDGGEVCDTKKKVCKPGGCESTLIPASPVPPNLLLTLDRSCSMTQKIDADETKWEIAVGAIKQITHDFEAKIRFGLTLFPDTTGDACVQDAPIPFDVGAGNEAGIRALLNHALTTTDPNYPSSPCVTNIDTAIAQAAGDATLVEDMDHPGFVLLMTDGKQSSGCTAGGGNDGTLAKIQHLAAKGIDTFVVGFGDGVDTVDLDKWATAGGVPATGGAHKYYDAADQQGLGAVLETIATKTISCVYQLDSEPPDEDKIFVFFDGTSVARDPSHQNGWDYDPATKKVTFYGTACGDLQMGDIADLQIVYGCDQPPPH